MQPTTTSRVTLDECIQSAAAMCVLLALVTIAFGPTEVGFAGLQLRVIYAGYCLLTCLALCGVTLTRLFARRRRLVRVLEARFSMRYTA